MVHHQNVIFIKWNETPEERQAVYKPSQNILLPAFFTQNS